MSASPRLGIPFFTTNFLYRIISLQNLVSSCIKNVKFEKMLLTKTFTVSRESIIALSIMY